MRLIRTAEVLREENWLAEAERIGKVEIGFEVMGSRREVRIETGKWGKCHLRLWGKGETIEQACRQAVERARVFGDMLPPHPDDC